MSSPSRRRVPGTVWMLAATVVAGVAGYAMQLSASARLDDPTLYVAFGTFWSAMYAMVALVSGVQNEVTRAVRPVGDGEDPGGTRDLLFVGAVGAGIVLVVVAGTVVVWPHLLVPASWMLLAGLSVLAVALLGGVMQGLARWESAALLTVTDSGLRMVLVVTAVLLVASPAWLYGSIAAPMAAAVLVVGAITWPRMRGRFVVDVGRSVLLRQVAGTVVASASLGVLVSGLPAVMSAAARDTDPQRLAELLMVTGLARAPLVVPIMAVQAILLVRFRDSSTAARRELRRVTAAVLALTAVVSVVGAVAGPWGLRTLTSGRYSIEPWFVAGTVAGAGALGVAVLVGAALLARSRHVAYVTLWTVAALGSVAILVGPGPLDVRAVVAMLVGPVLGVGAAALVNRRSSVHGTQPALR